MVGPDDYYIEITQDSSRTDSFNVRTPELPDLGSVRFYRDGSQWLLVHSNERGLLVRESFGGRFDAQDAASDYIVKEIRAARLCKASN